MKNIRIGMRFLLGLLLGLVVATWYMQHDKRFFCWVHRHIDTFFVETLKASFSGNIESINLFTLTFVLRDVVVKPLGVKKEWKWQSKKIVLKGSWLWSLLTKSCAVYATLIDLDAQTIIYGKSIPLVDHLYAMMYDSLSVVPILPQEVVLRHARLLVYDENKRLVVKSVCNGRSVRVGSVTKVRASVFDGSLLHDGRRIASSIQATCTADFSEQKKDFLPVVHLHGNATLLPSALYENTCAFHAHLDQGMIKGGIMACDGTFSGDLHGVQWRDQLVWFADIVSSSEYFFSLMGIKGIHCFGQVIGSIQGMGVDQCVGHVTFEKPSIGLYRLDRIETTFSSVRRWHGDIVCVKHDGRCTGGWHYVPSDLQLSLWLAVTSAWPLGDGKILCLKERSTFLDGIFDTEHAKMKYHLSIQQKGSENPSLLYGNIEYNLSNGTITTKGACDNDTYVITGKYDGNFAYPVSGHCAAADGTVWMKLHGGAPRDGFRPFSLILSYDIINRINRLFELSESVGQGQIHFEGRLNKTGCSASLSLYDGIIRFPGWYNYVAALSAHVSIDYLHKDCVVKNLVCSLCKGAITVPCMRIKWSHDEKGLFLHVPFALDECFYNEGDRWSSYFSGAGVMRYDDARCLCKGFVFCDRAWYKDFQMISYDLQKLQSGAFVWSHPIAQKCDIDLFLRTNDSVDIQTLFLDARADADMHIYGNLLQPLLEGHIRFASGELKLPYKPFILTHGNLYFLPHQGYEPTVDVQAQGHIKQYHVTLDIHGLLCAPKIDYTTVPYLSPEKVRALVFTGSEEESLNMVMPSVIARNLEPWLYEQAEQSIIPSPVKKILKPIKHIKILPSFVDQTGRGGFRGALDVQVDDHIRMLLQKNFSMSEDVRFEIEYLISDEMSFRGIKDERSDIGGEVEMRWKF